MLQATTGNRPLPLPDLEQANAAVLNRLSFAMGLRTYDHAITQFLVAVAMPSKALGTMP